MIHPQVIGGREVTEAESKNVTPDVAIIDLNGGSCTGVLIAPDLVLTAAHCTRGGVAAARFGIRFDQQGDGDGVETIKVARTAVYEKTDLFEHTDIADGDIAVLFLETPSTKKPRLIASQCVVDQWLKVGANAHVYGFGLQDNTVADGVKAGSLHTVALPITAVNAGEIVARGDSASACFGDSGGPVYVNTEVGTFLAALVSGGGDPDARACVGDNHFARVDVMFKWIEEVSARSLPRATCNYAPEVSVAPIVVAPSATTKQQIRVNDKNNTDALKFEIAKPPAHGKASISASGELEYIAPNQSGEDAFVIRVSDNGVPIGSKDVAVAVSIRAADDNGCNVSVSVAPSHSPATLLVALCASLALVVIRRNWRKIK